MLNHCGGRKKKVPNNQINQLIDLIPPGFNATPKKAVTHLEKDKSEDSVSNKPKPKDGVPIDTLEKSGLISKSIEDTDETKKVINRNVGFNTLVSKKKKVISIKPQLESEKDQEEEEQKESFSENPADLFGHDDLVEKWNNYANRIKHEGKTNLHTTLTKYGPELKPNFVVQVKIDNSVQEEVLLIEKLPLLDFLRAELNNYKIQLKTVLSESDSGNNLYTTRDKFEKLASKNPALNKLKDLLNLDLDY